MRGKDAAAPLAKMRGGRRMIERDTEIEIFKTEIYCGREEGPDPCACTSSIEVCKILGETATEREREERDSTYNGEKVAIYSLGRHRC